MIKGTLTANLNPPYLEFLLDDARYSRQHCSTDDLREFLITLDVLSPGQEWRPRELFVRIKGEFPRQSLAQFGLIP